jgi:hypothetical protein
LALLPLLIFALLLPPPPLLLLLLQVEVLAESLDEVLAGQQLALLKVVRHEQNASQQPCHFTHA